MPNAYKDTIIWLNMMAQHLLSLKKIWKLQGADLADNTINLADSPVIEPEYPKISS